MSAATATQSSAYGQPSLSRSSHQQDRHQEDSSDPMSSYQRIMHEHTRQQFETATASSRRRSVQSNNDEDASERKASLQSQSSVSSTSS